MIQSMQSTPIDRHFAAFINRLNGNGSNNKTTLQNLALLLSNAVSNGHVCLDLRNISNTEFIIDEKTIALPPFEQIIEELEQTTVTGKPGDFKPLVIDTNHRLYLYRYWNYERQLAETLLKMARSKNAQFDKRKAGTQLEKLFKKAPTDLADMQQVAALAALYNKLTIISGGPGTGKTSTVVKILALILEQSGTDLKIALTAPTGKAAARLNDSISQMKDALDISHEIKSAIPSNVTTIHRLLGFIPDSTHFRHNNKNHLPFDLIVVDEASMIPLPLMAKLVIALKPEARLILIGDKDQLSSVEAGAVLADLCGCGHVDIFSNSFLEICSDVIDFKMTGQNIIRQNQPLTDSVVILNKNYRFAESSAIGALSRAINSGDSIGTLNIMESGSTNELLWHESVSEEKLAPIIISGFRPYLEADNAKEALKLFDGFRILCAVKNGFRGVSGINQTVEKILAANGLIEPNERWYHGRPVMVTVNDYHLKLFNGDIGMAFIDSRGDGSLKIYFPGEGGELRAFSPFRLPANETVYAMTVHKSQGSEFEKLSLILPENDSRVMTRELLYTAITRAKASVEIFGDKNILTEAVKRTVERNSGLMDRLWQR